MLWPIHQELQTDTIGLTIGLSDVGGALERSDDDEAERHEQGVHDGHIDLAQMLHHIQVISA